ncbi:MAG TPA: radical SAM protein [Desulfonatronum sp.]|nr:radical SAM protein [Desulfonatronum sp.]
MDFKTLYGPVRSGRLGLSLGVDLLGKRICSMDCLYCEVGPTLAHTLQRLPYTPAKVVLEELSSWREQKLPTPEHITLGGLGEPCLNSDLPEIIVGARKLFPDVPVAVLTNSTLLCDPDVRRELAFAQVVLPSLDTLVEREFLAINRPCRGVVLSQIAVGLLDFRREYAGAINLEILLLQNINDTRENLALQKDFIAKLRPDRVDVVTMTRPGSSPLAKAADPQTLAAWREALKPVARLTKAPGQIQPRFAAETISKVAASELILNSLRRRPQTPDDLAAAIGVKNAQVRMVIDELLFQELIVPAKDFGDDFYRAVL